MAHIHEILQNYKSRKEGKKFPVTVSGLKGEKIQTNRSSQPLLQAIRQQ